LRRRFLSLSLFLSFFLSSSSSEGLLLFPKEGEMRGTERGRRRERARPRRERRKQKERKREKEKK
jgi:hypothetical protein